VQALRRGTEALSTRTHDEDADMMEVYLIHIIYTYTICKYIYMGRGTYFYIYNI
jgi:hypothetical protein